jgi:hypothetical protein
MKYLIPILLIALAGCTSSPPVSQPEFVGKYKNACLPEAIAMTQALKQSGVQAKVVIINTPDFSHALSCYLYPVGQNKLWVWDSYWKSMNLRAWWNNSDSVAKEWLKWCTTDTKLVSSHFLEN